MTYRTAFLISTVLGLSVCLCQVAEAQGGLPAVDRRVTTLENTVAAQQTTVATQQAATQALTDRVSTLESKVASQQVQMATLQNHLPMFAVVDADGTLRASSSGVRSVEIPLDSSGNPITGHYLVFFARDVSRCAATLTAEPQYSGGIIASINGTRRGISEPDTFIVVLSDHENNRINTRFNLVVQC